MMMKYIVYDELKKHFKQGKISYEKISFCSGVIKIFKQ